jgi:Glycosyl hydrolases family 32 N-terminal domain
MECGMLRTSHDLPRPIRTMDPARRPPGTTQVGPLTGWAIRLALVVLASLGPPPPRAGAAWMVPPWPYRPKECSLIRRGTTFHLFYTRGIYGAPFDSTWRDLGHAISSDLVHWTDLAPVLPYRPGKWDNFQIWAPAVFQKDSVFYMFYTGVTQQLPAYDHHQRIGLATSTDLVNWTRRDQPVFECNQVPWAFCSPAPGPGDFRDPYVMADPDSAGHWLMYYTTRPAAAPGNFIIGYARSRGDLTQWTDGGPLWNTFITHTSSSVVETPDVIRHGSLWYLLYTTWLGHPIGFQTALSPTADSTHWSIQRSLYQEVTGIDTDPAFGPEHATVDGHDLYAMPDSYYNAIEILEYAWHTPPDFDLVQPYTTIGMTAVTDTTRVMPFDLHALGARAPIRLVLDLPYTGSARVWISDVTGRRIAAVSEGVRPGGRSVLVWDGRTTRGTAVPGGIYFAVAESAHTRRSARIVLLP